VPPNAEIPDEVMALGAPARVRGPLTAGARVWVDGNPSIYQELARRHAAGAALVPHPTDNSRRPPTGT
jgi:carbonic anhydrase/acetyltransferase-like protein (isoleucine patch superfamily)